MGRTVVRIARCLVAYLVVWVRCTKVQILGTGLRAYLAELTNWGEGKGPNTTHHTWEKSKGNYLQTPKCTTTGSEGTATAGISRPLATLAQQHLSRQEKEHKLVKAKLSAPALTPHQAKPNCHHQGNLCRYQSLGAALNITTPFTTSPRSP